MSAKRAKFRVIPLTHGQSAIVDASDFEFLSQWTWYAQWQEGIHGFYAVRRGPKNGQMSMHRLILGCERGEQVDHRNHNSLDNRRDNLRKCSTAENAANHKTYRNNRSGFTGVFWYQKRQRWIAQVKVKSQTRNLGSFRTAEEAAKARDAAVIAMYGEFAVLNFPSGDAR